MHEAEHAHANRGADKEGSRGFHSARERLYLKGNALKMPSKSPVMKLTSAKPLNVLSSQMDHGVSRRWRARVCVEWLECSIIQCF